MHDGAKQNRWWEEDDYVHEHWMDSLISIDIFVKFSLQIANSAAI